MNVIVEEEQETPQQINSNAVSTMVLQVLDRLRVKVRTTDSFPMDIECTLMITQDDMEEFARIEALQTKKLKELETIVPNQMDDGLTSYD